MHEHPAGRVEIADRPAQLSDQTRIARCDRRALGPRGEDGEEADHQRRHDRGRTDEPARESQCRIQVAKQQQRAEHQSDDTADGEQAVARHLDLGDEEDQRQQDQADAGQVHRQYRQGIEAEDERNPADDARKHRARVGELEVDAEKADAHQQISDVGMHERRQQALQARHLDVGDPRPAQGECALAPRLVPGTSFEGHQELCEVRRHDLDESLGEGLLIGERAALDHGLFRQRDVAAMATGESPDRRRRVLLHLRPHDPLDRLALPADRVGGAGVGARRHGGEIGRHQEEEAR